MKLTAWTDFLQGDAAGILGDGSYRVFLTNDGGGFSAFEDYAVTAWSGPRAEHPQGFSLYLRDLDSGRFGLLGRPPAGRPAGNDGDAADDGALRRLGVVELTQDADGLDCCLEICVPSGADLELRRLTLTNRSSSTRRIEITSYIEAVLNQPAAHAAHPVFSKLFLQTERRSPRDVLVVRRRPRGSHERHPLLFHALAGAPVTGFETDRARFVGRGRSLLAPAALVGPAPLSGSTGNVLDPSLCLRTVLELEPGVSSRITYLLGGAGDPDRLSSLVDRFSDTDRIETAFRKAGEGAPRFAVAVPSFARPEGETAGKPDNAGRQLDNAGRQPDDAGRRTDGASVEPLSFDNGYGGFSPDGTEYVIRVPVDKTLVPTLPPRPWINIVANESFGFMVSETGAGTTWNGNSREHRLTPWFNDPLLDPHGEALYLRDEDSGESWSPCPGPAPAAADYEMCHGFGYSRCVVTHGDLESEALFFVPRHDPVKIQRVRLTNRSSARRRLSLFAYYRLLLGGGGPDTGRSILTEYDPAGRLALARRTPAAEHGEAVAFAALVADDELVGQHFTGDREAFLGRDGNPSSPAALMCPHLDGRSGPGLDPCFAQQARIEVEPGATVEIVLLFGEAPGADEARVLADRFRAPGAAGESLDEVRRFWTGSLTRVRIETPSPALDLMVNGWLTYQTLACRIWGRSALYQSGGAFGYRDQLQDAASLIPWWPEAAREQILRNAAHQFVEGDVLHWWHPPHSRGIRTRFADDMVWLPLLTAHYLRATGDEAILDETVRFLRAPLLEPGEDEVYLRPEDSGETADLYEHCGRALDRALTRGAHGLPLFGGGDWNDGMNRVGHEGRGESVWMGFFLYHTLGEFLPLCEKRKDGERARRYRDYREAVREALETAGWDGNWYRRAYYDDGTALGSDENTECRIDALVQAWAVISGAAPHARAEQAMDAAQRHLVSEDEGLIRLLTPPFDKTSRDPGYIKGYVPGVRENGGQYTHAALWMVQAAARLGRRDRAARWLDMLNPVHHARNAGEVATYQVEPYVVSADVYGAPPHVGRGGWSWYTGSSGWMLRVALETILGFTLDGGERILLEPRIPDEWPGYRLDYRFPDHETLYEITVTNPEHRAERVTAATLNGDRIPVENGAARVPVLRDGETHRVEVVLGPKVSDR